MWERGTPAAVTGVEDGDWVGGWMKEVCNIAKINKINLSSLIHFDFMSFSSDGIFLEALVVVMILELLYAVLFYL